MDKKHVVNLDVEGMSFKVRFIECKEIETDPTFIERTYYELEYVEGLDNLPNIIYDNLDIESFENELLDKAIDTLSE